jgi:hypothetical protein
MEAIVRDAQSLYRLRQLEAHMRGRPTLRHRKLMVWRRARRMALRMAWQVLVVSAAGLAIGGLVSWMFA